jgi:hypothetical protein
MQMNHQRGTRQPEIYENGFIPAQQCCSPAVRCGNGHVQRKFMMCIISNTVLQKWV